MRRYDAVVIGAGAVGCAAACELGQRLPAGSRFALIERFAPGHDRGSSHGPSRIIRTAYDRPEYVALVAEAFARWEALERRSGEALRLRTGEVFFGPADGPLAAYEAALAAAGVRTERHDPEAMRARLPILELPDDHAALTHPDGGILAADRCIHVQLELARQAGCELLSGLRVERIERRADGLLLAIDGGEPILAARLAVAAGPWIGELLPELALPLRVARQQVVYLRPRRDPDRFRPDAMPVWVSLDRRIYYGLPIWGRFGVKAALHDTGADAPRAEPDRIDRAPDAAAIAETQAFMASRFPALADAEPVEPHVCLYTMTPDERLLIDVHPDDARIAYASACSGHGFKFSCLTGAILATLVLCDTPPGEVFTANRSLFRP